jgi:hypothetical protein
MENRQSRRAASAVAVVAAAEHVTAEDWISTHSSASCPPTSWPGHSTGSTRSTPTRCWIDCSPPTGSRPSCVTCWSPTSTTSASAGPVGRSRSPRSTLPPTCCEAACSGWPAAGPRPRSRRRPGLPAWRAARPRADRLRHHPVPAGLAHHLPGAGHADRHHRPSHRAHRARPGRPGRHSSQALRRQHRRHRRPRPPDHGRPRRRRRDRRAGHPGRSTSATP